jgi:dihydropyrimidinase
MYHLLVRGGTVGTPVRSVEEAAIRRAMLLAERSGSPLYVLHMAAGSGIEALAEGHARGLPFYGETLSPYLSFTADKLWDDENRGLLWNNYPTIKFQEDQDLLWQAIADNRLQVVSSDHFLMAGDRYGNMGVTVDALQAGQAGVELRIPVLFHLGVQGGRITVNRFVELVSTNRRRSWVLIRERASSPSAATPTSRFSTPTARGTVHHGDLQSGDYSCWEGWELRGKIKTTILRGRVLVEDEQWVGPKTAGQFVPRTLLPEIASSSPDFSATFASSAQAATV